jgi:DNA-binding response OmpR family regulator
MVDRIQSAGFDAVVFKPYSLAEMSELLRSLTRRVHEL